MPIPDNTIPAIQDFKGPDRPMKVDGVGRMADNPKFVLIGLSQVPSDNDLRTLHEFLRAWPKCVDDGCIDRARRIVDEHVEASGKIASRRTLCEAIATELGFVQLASIPHRENVADLRKMLTAASHALKSYAYGNASPDLAKGIAEKIDGALEMTGGSNG